MRKKFWVTKCPDYYDWGWAVAYKDSDGEEMYRALFETRKDARKFLESL